MWPFKSDKLQKLAELCVWELLLTNFRFNGFGIVVDGALTVFLFIFYSALLVHFCSVLLNLQRLTTLEQFILHSLPIENLVQVLLHSDAFDHWPAHHELNAGSNLLWLSLNKSSCVRNYITGWHKLVSDLRFVKSSDRASTNDSETRLGLFAILKHTFIVAVDWSVVGKFAPVLLSCSALSQLH